MFVKSAIELLNKSAKIKNPTEDQKMEIVEVETTLSLFSSEL